MAELTVRGVRKRFGTVQALAGVDLTVVSGQLMAVLGPSGCGKTTLLRCIAGFEPVDAGAITVAGHPMTNWRPERRRIAVVPQEGALFPHLSVVGNVGYGLRQSRWAAVNGTTRDRIAEVLEMVGLSGLGDRMPHQLSGGQQQRVAVARALAPRPPILLLDEPFSALDAALRADLRRDVRAALHADGATALLVTHDQGEALSIADEIAVLKDGRVVQHGAPTDVYAAPADPWVAGFVGDAVWLSPAHALLQDVPVIGSGSRVLVRPEQIGLTDTAADTDGCRATVVRRNFHGHDAVLGVRLPAGDELSVRILGPLIPDVGTAIGVRVAGPVRAYDGG